MARAGFSTAADCRAGCSNSRPRMETMNCVCRRTIVPGRRVCSSASRRQRASTVRRGAGSTIPRSTVCIVSAMAGTIRVCVPGPSGAQVEWLLGYPDKAWGSARKHWRWPSASLTRSARPWLCIIYFMFLLDRGEPDVALQRLDSAEARREQRLGSVLERGLLRGVALTSAGEPSTRLPLLSARGACWPRLVLPVGHNDARVNDVGRCADAQGRSMMRLFGQRDDGS